jgi:hypothetical protein
MGSVTVTDGCTEGFSKTNIHGYTTVFCGRGRIAQPLSSLSSICIVFCIDVNELKQACPLKSDISLLALNPLKMPVVSRI